MKMSKQPRKPKRPWLFLIVLLLIVIGLAARLIHKLQTGY